MPYAKNGDINIYYEVEGDGPFLLLHHGLMRSLEDYRDTGFVDALKDDYRLILMDARGHGKSDKPHDPALYSDENIASDVIAVLDELGVESTVFYGYSYGGGVAFECAVHAPERMKALIIGGAGADVPSPESMQDFIRILEVGPEIFIDNLEMAGPLPMAVKSRLMMNDHRALIAVCRAMGSRNGRKDNLPEMTMPFLLFAGDSDPAYPAAREASELLPDARFISIPDTDHSQAAEDADLLVSYITDFLSGIC